MIFNNDKIEFYCNEQLYDIIPKPTLASKRMPDWFKKIKPELDQDREISGRPGLTAKKCLPMLDAMSLGYIISLPGDIYVITNHDCSIIKAEAIHTNNVFSVIERHSYKQVHSSSWPTFKQDPIKFINHWHIKTAPGWSCLFQAPLNHLNPDFQCLSGVVDTDNYPGIINFPAVWLKPNFDGKIPAGTPLVQVIPFKRSIFKDKDVKTRTISKKEQKQYDTLRIKQVSREHVYTEELREKR